MGLDVLGFTWIFAFLWGFRGMRGIKDTDVLHKSRKRMCGGLFWLVGKYFHVVKGLHYLAVACNPG